MYSLADSIRTWMVSGRILGLYCLLAAEFISGQITKLVILLLSLFQLEMKQRYLVGKMNVPEEKEGDPDEVTMESLGEDSCPRRLCYEKKYYFADFCCFYSLQLKCASRRASCCSDLPPVK